MMNAYRLGWSASKRSHDLERAERRFIDRHNPTREQLKDWTDGWVAYAAGYPYGEVVQ